MESKAITNNQFGKLISYLAKMGVEHTVEDKCGTIVYTDDVNEKTATLLRKISNLARK